MDLDNYNGGSRLQLFAFIDQPMNKKLFLTKFSSLRIVDDKQLIQ